MLFNCLVLGGIVDLVVWLFVGRIFGRSGGKDLEMVVDWEFGGNKLGRGVDLLFARITRRRNRQSLGFIIFSHQYNYCDMVK